LELYEGLQGGKSEGSSSPCLRHPQEKKFVGEKRSTRKGVIKKKFTVHLKGFRSLGDLDRGLIRQSNTTGHTVGKGPKEKNPGKKGRSA